MKTSQKYYTHFEKIVLNSIDLEPYDITTETLFQTFTEVYDIFKKEYVHHNNRHISEVTLFKEWLQGLPSVLSVPFQNYDILQNALLSGFDVSTEAKEDDFLDSYWFNLSQAFFTLKNNI